MRVAYYLGRLEYGERELTKALRKLGERYAQDYEISEVSHQLAGWSWAQVSAVLSFADTYGKIEQPAARSRRPAHPRPAPGLALLLDLQEVLLIAHAARTDCTILYQSARTLKDKALEQYCADCGDQIDRQIAWLCTRIKVMAPQAVTVLVPEVRSTSARPKPSPKPAARPKVLPHAAPKSGH